MAPSAARPTTFLMLAGGMALFGSATPVSKLLGEAFPAMLASALRMLTAAVVLGPVLAAARSRGSDTSERPRGRDWWWLAGIAVVGTFGFTWLLFQGMRTAPAAVGSVVMATTPAITALGAVIVLRERLSRWTAAGVAAAVAGVVVVNLGGPTAGEGDNPWLGSLLVFGAVCCEAAYSLLGKKLTASLSPLAISAWAAAGALLAFAPFAVTAALGFDWSAPTAGDWAAMVWWGAGTMGLGSVLWFSGMRRVSGATASGFMAVMPISALVLSYLLLGEQFHWSHLAGVSVVLLGLGVVIYADVGANPHG